MNDAYRPSYGSPSLTDQTMANLETFFREKTHHHPTPAMMLALKGAAQVIEDMANGTCNPLFYLSSVDPGVGKTSMLSESLRSILSSLAHRDVGILVCVARLSEIRNIVDHARLGRAEFAAFTSDPETNDLGLGKVRANEARVLFTTQQMINSRCDGKMFAEASEFHFKGQPRAVRVWDEAFLPGETLTVSRSHLLKLASEWLASYPLLGFLVESLAHDLRDSVDGDTVSIPDLAADIGATKEAMLEALPGSTTESHLLTQAATTLWLLSGKKVSIRKDTGRKKGELQTVLSFRDHHPSDFAPVLILDASGRVRKTYDFWECSDRGDLVKLPEAKKTYRNLKVHVWKRGGGKSAFRSRPKYEEMLQGICNTIDSSPTEKFLVVHHKAEGSFDVETDVRVLIDSNRTGEVAFTSWGHHKASNEWADVPNIILAGTLFYPNSHYEALGRLSSNLAPGHPFGQDLYSETCLGEHRDGILQAGCRGAIRCSVDGDCPPSNLYIIAAAGSGIPGALQAVFPGCQRRDWTPVRRKLSKKCREAVDLLNSHFGRDPGSFLKFTTVRQALGGMDGKNFKHRIRRDPAFVATLAEMGVVETTARNGVHATGFMMEAASFGFMVAA